MLGRNFIVIFDTPSDKLSAAGLFKWCMTFNPEVRSVPKWSYTLAARFLKCAWTFWDIKRDRVKWKAGTKGLSKFF